MNITDRMTALLTARGVKPRSIKPTLAKTCGISYEAVRQWFAGETNSIKNEHLVAVAKHYETTVDWLLTGKGAMDGAHPFPESTAPKPESNAVMIGMMSAWDSDTPLHDDEVAIPFYKEVEMAAGSGATEVVEVPGRLLRFAKSTLRDAGVAEQNAACVQIRGNSMERLIMDGATVGIDRGTTQIIDGEMYAIDHDGMLRIKYLYRMPGGGLRIRSENSEEHPDEILSAEDAARIRVLGWVFWWSTVRRRRGMQR